MYWRFMLIIIFVGKVVAMRYYHDPGVSGWMKLDYNQFNHIKVKTGLSKSLILHRNIKYESYHIIFLTEYFKI